MNSKTLQQQLMVVFQEELEEHLQTLNTGLVTLETGLPSADEGPLLSELFRAAHSLKGAARGVGIPDIAQLAHALEDVLSAFREHSLAPTPPVLDAVFPTLDLIQEVMDAYLSGENLPPNRVEKTIAHLEAVLQGDEAPPETRPQAGSRVYDTPALPAEDSIRVATAKLDSLMDSMGELVASRLRMEQRLNELLAVQQDLGRWSKAWRQIRSDVNMLRRSNGHAPQLEETLQFLDLTEENLKTFSTGLHHLTRRFNSDQDLLSQLSDEMQDQVQRLRMRPIGALFENLPRIVRDLARAAGKQVQFEMQGLETEVDRELLEGLKDPITHLLRNAIDHGIETPETRADIGKTPQGRLSLRAVQQRDNLLLEVSDDGAGIDRAGLQQAVLSAGVLTAGEVSALSDQETIDLIFLAGISTRQETTDLSGRGVGMDVVRSNLERLDGVIQIDTQPGAGTTFSMTLPIHFVTRQVLLVETEGQTFAIPTTAIDRVLRVESSQIGRVDGRPAIHQDGRLLSLLSLARVLELPSGKDPLSPGQEHTVLVIRSAEKRFAFQVDKTLATLDVVIRSLGGQLRSVRNVAGATILGSGKLVIYLDVASLLKTAQASLAQAAVSLVEKSDRQISKLLVVDDSITTRTLEKNILENAGYRVWVAADGVEAWALVQRERLDAVVADVDMPKMDGIQLTQKIKGHQRWSELPVILVTSLDSPQDKIRGLEAGADAYLVKSGFDQTLLLETIERLIG